MLSLVLILAIIAVALVLFVGGWLRVDLVGLLVLSALALTGLVTAEEALAGFSSPAVVTVWAMFILSAGLTRTGVADLIGRPLQRFTKAREALLVTALMVAASLLSAMINTVTVAAILLPAAMELSRRSGRPPSRLLMPMSLGTLLGGPFTAISTPPNLLATDALRFANLEPFALFDFTPITAAIVAAGTAFVVLAGRHLLPTRPAEDIGGRSSIGSFYQLDTHIFTTRIPRTSPLDSRTVAESRLGSALYLTVVAVQRRGKLMLAPRPDYILHAEDTLIVHGRPDHLQRFHGRQHLQIEGAEEVKSRVSQRLHLVEAIVPEGSPLSGVTIGESDLRRGHRVHVLTLRAADDREIRDLRRRKLAVGDRLLLQGEPEAITASIAENRLEEVRRLSLDEAGRAAGGVTLTAVRVPPGSVLADRDLVESRLGNAFGLTVVGIRRGEALQCMPSPQERVLAGDLLVLQGSRRDLDVLKGLQELEIREQTSSLVAELESQEIGATEVLLSPRTTLAGRSLADLRFRDRYGLSVLAIWRKSRAYRTGLQDMVLQFGDALLVYGHRRDLETMARDPDFLVLDQASAQAPRLEKARLAAAIMAAVILSAIAGWVPIAVAALSGAALMVLTGCLSMEDAYRAIDWKVVFLIASMLPLGVALENTGAARIGAEALIAAVGHHGPRWVVAALFLVTVIGTQVIPTAALVVLMAPVALSTAGTLGISPHLLMMTVAISASASFASPLSHPAHLLVMGPGGYRFMDYVKVGVPLTLIAMAVSIGLLPVLWPP